MQWDDDFIKQVGIDPYYKDEHGVIYCGDCIEVMKEIPDGVIDTVITDPPYGIGFKYDNYDDNRDDWYKLMNKVIPQIRSLARFVIMPSCGIDRIGWWYQHHQPDWMMAWYKGSPGHLSYVGFNDWEAHLVWGKPPQQMHDYFQTRCGVNDNKHPCPKPIEWARWLISRSSKENDIILDPFLGSGTTAVAAKQLGRRYIGIEINPDYCRIATDRLRQTELALTTPADSRQIEGGG